jgi:hypothetical protein
MHVSYFVFQLSFLFLSFLILLFLFLYGNKQKQKTFNPPPTKQTPLFLFSSFSRSMEELTALVHHVYGEKVSKSESGLHVTNNVTDIATAKIVIIMLCCVLIIFIILKSYIKIC